MKYLVRLPSVQYTVRSHSITYHRRISVGGGEPVSISATTSPSSSINSIFALTISNDSPLPSSAGSCRAVISPSLLLYSTCHLLEAITIVLSRRRG